MRPAARAASALHDPRLFRALSPAGKENASDERPGKRKRDHAENAVRRDLLPGNDEAERQRQSYYDDAGSEARINRPAFAYTRRARPCRRGCGKAQRRAYVPHSSRRGVG